MSILLNTSITKAYQCIDCSKCGHYSYTLISGSSINAMFDQCFYCGSWLFSKTYNDNKNSSVAFTFRNYGIDSVEHKLYREQERFIERKLC